MSTPASPLGSPDVSSLPPVSNQAPPAPTQAPVPPPDTRSTAAKVIDAIGGILGGRTRTTYQVDANGKTVPVQTPNSGGQQARNILGGALRGLAAGAQVHGPGAGFRSFAAGAGEEQQHAQKQDELRRQQASTDFEQSQQALARKGQIAMQNQQIAESTWRMVREQGEIDTKTADRLNEMNAMVASDSRNKDYGHYESFKDFADKHKDLGVNIPQLQAQGALRAIPTFEGGKPTGVQVYELHPAWADQKNDEPVKISVPSGLDDKGKPSYKDYTIPAQGMSNGDILRAQIGLGSQAMKGSLDASEAAKNKAQGTEALAGAAHTEEETKQLKDFDNQTTIAGDKLGLPGDKPSDYKSRYKDFAKTYVLPLVGLEKTGEEFNRINNDPKISPAEKVTGLLAAVGISFDPLKGKGARLSNSVIGEHAQATDIYQKALQKVDQLRPGGGGPITEKQIHDYAAIANGVIADAQIAAGREAVRQGLNPDFLPKAQMTANGSKPPATPDQARIYLQVYNGDINKAHAALVAQGYAP